jgi:hypothetical protein
MIEHTNSANHSADSSMGKEANTMLRNDSDDLINVLFKGARLMGRV